jgi:thiamine-phosphate pyrophosphorylase
MAGREDTDRAVVVRILDANANRCAEGLRVVEEIARFSMEDASLTGRLKDMRHRVRRSAEAIARGALRHRDSVGDVGSGSATASELARGSLAAVARANFARAEEALRVLEEFGKLIDDAGSRVFKSLRFELYTIERAFFAGPVAGASMPRSPFLYAVLDRGTVGGDRVAAAAAALAAAGVDMIQYRAKDAGGAERRGDVAAILAAARVAAIPVIVNDDVELAAETGADGVHIGADDLPPAEARAIVGPDRIVGVSVASPADLPRALAAPVDYIGVGPVYRSPTKPEAKALGVQFVREVRSETALPLVAIGGITAANAVEVIDAGADGIAVVSAIFAGDIGKNCFTLKGIIATRLRQGTGGPAGS